MSENNKRIRISKEAFEQITERVRSAAYIVRDDILRKRITQDTHKNLQDIFDFVDELSDDNKWEIWSFKD